jgi:hypothetical protein
MQSITNDHKDYGIFYHEVIILTAGYTPCLVFSVAISLVFCVVFVRSLLAMSLCFGLCVVCPPLSYGF